VVRKTPIAAIGFLACSWLPVHAGMTVITLTDVAKARLESVSFFCVIYLLLALGVMGLWNYLAKSFDWMPRINYRRALALMLISGLFLYVILTMISGARELMTPGAWDKRGVGYELNAGEQAPSKDVRRKAIENLQTELWEYAKQHDGKLPKSLFDDSFATQKWGLPHMRGYYAYISGRKIGRGRDVVVYEPSVMGRKRFVILTDGSIELWREDTLKKRLGLDE